MDPIGRATPSRRVPLTSGTTSGTASGASGILRPVRFEPPQLSGTTSRRTAAQEQAEAVADAVALAVQSARAEAAAVMQRELEEVKAHHEAARRRMDRAALALESAVLQLGQYEQELTDQLQDRAVDFALSIAEEVVGRELRATDDAVLDAIRRAARLVPDRGDVVLRIHPDDVELVAASLAELPVIAGRADVLADDSVERSGCIAAVGHLRIDAQLGAAFDRVRAAIVD